MGLKKLIAACYRNQDPDLFSRSDSERAIWLEYNGNTKVGRVPDVEDMATCLRFHNFPRSAPVLVTHVSHWDDAAAAYVTAEYVARPLGAIRVAAAGTYRIVASSTPHPNYPTVISMKRSPDCSPMRGATLNYSGRSASVGYGTPIGSLKRGRTTYNDGFIRPLDAAELLGILKSVLRYRDKWCEHGHQQSFLFRQALRGRKGRHSVRLGASGECLRQGSIHSRSVGRWRRELPSDSAGVWGACGHCSGRSRLGSCVGCISKPIQIVVVRELF